MERRVTSKVFFLGGEGREMAVGVEEVGSCSPAELSRWKNESLMFRFYLQHGRTDCSPVNPTHFVADTQLAFLRAG